MAQVHIIGAGLAGLGAALRLAERGHGPAIRLYEAAPQAGGRCRSYADKALGCVLDNGNHLVMSGNRAAVDHVARLHGGDANRGLAESPGGYTFLDRASGARWSIQPNRGPIPWWLLKAATRIPGTRLIDYASMLRVLASREDATLAERVAPDHPLMRAFWDPLTVAALNTTPAQAAAVLMRPVLLETFAKGWDHCRPLMARDSLGHAFIDPALAALATAGAGVRFGARLRGLDVGDGRITALRFGDAEVPLAPEDAVVLAVPAWIAPDLLPGLPSPGEGEPIVNVHYKLDQSGPDHAIVGILGGVSQWVFLRGPIAAVTISAARAEAEWDADVIAARCWPEVAAALGQPDLPQPPARVVKEKRATFAQTPAALSRRPPAKGPLANLWLAGDWTDTGLPATIEGALRSGHRAGALVADRLDGRAALTANGR